MKRTLAALVLLLCLASCQRGIKTNVFTDEMKLPLAEGCQDTLSVQILLEYPVGEDSVSQAMNRSILAFAFDMEEDPTTVEETAARFEAGLVDAYFDEMAPIHAEEEDPELAGIHSWEESITGYFGDVYKKLVTYYIEYYGYRGGAHGIPTLTPMVFSTETGAAVQESDFFVDGYQEGVSALLRDNLLAALDGDAEAYDALFVKDIAPNGCFDVTRKGVTWYYQPYEIGPYYLGVISVSLPWEDLKEYIRK
ncbi:MAG: DUF3298 domain-containing protein [Bacteroidales bacterium]|jgi:hypothetical protein|nr:DUF3298 domain-containing protein [Bacteroidales bacterium]